MTVSRHRLIQTLTGTACLFGLTSMSAEGVPATWTFLGLVALSLDGHQYADAAKPGGRGRVDVEGHRAVIDMEARGAANDRKGSCRSRRVRRRDEPRRTCRA